MKTNHNVEANAYEIILDKNDTKLKELYSKKNNKDVVFELINELYRLSNSDKRLSLMFETLIHSHTLISFDKSTDGSEMIWLASVDKDYEKQLEEYKSLIGDEYKAYIVPPKVITASTMEEVVEIALSSDYEADIYSYKFDEDTVSYYIIKDKNTEESTDIADTWISYIKENGKYLGKLSLFRRAYE